ncbi:hypothetical protein GCM10027217_25270 [Pseudomaricurvus hydrocarbonicus]
MGAVWEWLDIEVLFLKAKRSQCAFGTTAYLESLAAVNEVPLITIKFCLAAWVVCLSALGEGSRDEVGPVK